MGHSGECEWLHTNPPACNQSYAESLGQTYDTTQIIYAIWAFLLELWCLYHSRVIFQRRGLKRPFSTQVKLFMITNILCITLVIRAIDPFGWRLIVPATIIYLAYDIGAASVYAILLVLVHDWIKITLFFTPGFKTWLPWLNRSFFTLNVFQATSFIVWSILQTNVDPQWQWRSIKLLIGSLVLIVVIITQAFFGCRIYSTLQRNARNMTSNGNDTTNSGDRSSSVISLNDAERGRSSTTGRRVFRASTRKRTDKVNRILKYLVVCTIGLSLCVLFQVFTVMQNLDKKYTIEHPADAPSGVGDVLFEGFFDLGMAISAMVVIHYFRFREDQKEESVSSRDISSSRQRKSTRTAALKYKPEEPQEAV